MAYFAYHGDGFRYHPHPCGRCGLRHSYGQCKAISARCNFCLCYGHYARKCFSRKQQQYCDFQQRVLQYPVPPLHQQCVFQSVPVSSVGVPVSAAPTAQRPKKKSAKRRARDQRRMENFKLLQQALSEFPFAQLSDHNFHSEVNKGFTQQAELHRCKSKISSFVKKLKQADKEKKEQTVSVNSLETELANKDSHIISLETRVSELESELKEVKFWKDKIAKSSEIQGEIMDELNEKILCHIETIRTLEYKLTPGVYHLYQTGGRKGRGQNRQQQAPRKPTKCAIGPCENSVLRCEKCGKSIENSFCDVCKMKTDQCSDCMYMVYENE